MSAYYNRNCKKMKLNRNMQYLDHGCCAHVFTDKDIILKKYFKKTPWICRLKPKMFDLLKDIKNPHFIELYEIYQSLNLIQLFKYKQQKFQFITSAYSAKYYEKDSIDILYESIDYLLDNFRELEILFQIFSDNLIVPNDVKKHNTIFGSNNIVIIDPDFFHMSHYNKVSTSIQNKKILLALLKSICIERAKKEEDHERIVSKIKNELIDIKINKDTDVTYEISKKLGRSKSLKNYFY